MNYDQYLPKRKRKRKYTEHEKQNLKRIIRFTVITVAVGMAVGGLFLLIYLGQLAG